MKMIKLVRSSSPALFLLEVVDTWHLDGHRVNSSPCGDTWCWIRTSRPLGVGLLHHWQIHLQHLAFLSDLHLMQWMASRMTVRSYNRIRLSVRNYERDFRQEYSEIDVENTKYQYLPWKLSSDFSYSWSLNSITAQIPSRRNQRRLIHSAVQSTLRHLAYRLQPIPLC